MLLKQQERSCGRYEMLIESHHDETILLPALPESWSYGKVSGLQIRGGFEVSVS